MDVDVQRQRLFVAALGNNSVEVVDVRRGMVIHSIGGLDEPQGIRYIPKSDKLVVANGGDGTVRIFDCSKYAEIGRITFSDDADNVRYAPSANRIYVGYGSGALGIIDASTFKVLGTIALPGHPESFQLDRDGSRIFVNVPAARRIVEVDPMKQQVTGSIALESESANYPMAVDHDRHLLFVGFRKPPCLLVFDTESQRQVSRVDIDGDTDDLFFDSGSNRIYCSCGSGSIDVVAVTNPGKVTVISRITSAPGARTSFFAPHTRQLFLAVPHRGDQGAAIWVYDAKP